MFITGQTNSQPPHFMTSMYTTDMLEDQSSTTSYHMSDFEEYAMDKDSEMDFSSGEDDDIGGNQNNNVTHQASTMTVNQEAYKAHIEHIALLTTRITQRIIIDSGADCHVGGQHWLTLTPTNGPHVH